MDTYDTLEGVRKVIDLSRKLGDQFRVRAVRLDSGYLGSLASQTRKILDEAGLVHVTIFASSSLDEDQIQHLVNAGAPIDTFGVGTKLAVVEGASHLDMAYKLVEYGGKGRLKLSTKKVLYPGRKQMFRHVEAGHMVRDEIGRFDEELPGERLLQPMMRQGCRTGDVDLEESRRRFQSESMRLPEHLRKLEPSPAPYAVSCLPPLLRAESSRGGRSAEHRETLDHSYPCARTTRARRDIIRDFRPPESSGSRGSSPRIGRVKIVLLDLIPECIAADPQDTSSFGLIARGFFQGAY